MDLIRRALGVDVEKRSTQTDPYAIPSPGMMLLSDSGIVVSETTMLQLQAVWSCVSLISDTLSMLPKDAYRPDPAGFLQPMSSQPQLLRDPHPEMTPAEWIGRLALSLVLRGNGYGAVEAVDGFGFPTMIRPLHPDEVGPRRNRDTRRIEYLLFGTMEAAPSWLDQPRVGSVVHIRGMTLPGTWSIIGLSPLQFLRQTVGLGLAALQFGGSFFADGANPSGVLQQTHFDETVEQLTEEDAKTYQTKWVESHGSRHRKPAVLTGGLEWKPISINPDEAQFLETRKFSRSEIAGFYRVPPFMIGDTESPSAWGKGIEELGHQFVDYTMGIWLRRFEEWFTRMLPSQQLVRFDTSALLRGRLLDRYNAYLLSRQAGWQNADEIRKQEGQPPIPDGGGESYVPLPPGVPLVPGAAPSGSSGDEPVPVQSP